MNSQTQDTLSVEEKQTLGESEAASDSVKAQGQMERQLNAAYRLAEQLIGKTWFEAWTLDDVCLMLRNALSHPRCPTCKGSGYQSLIGAPGCMGGCEDCDGTGLALVGKREAPSGPSGVKRSDASVASSEKSSPNAVANKKEDKI